MDFATVQEDVKNSVYMVFLRPMKQTICPYPNPEQYYVFWWHKDGMRLFWTEDGAEGKVRTTTSILGGVTTFQDSLGYAIMQMYMYDGKGGQVTRVLLKFNGLSCTAHGRKSSWLSTTDYKKKNPYGYGMYEKLKKTTDKYMDQLNSTLRERCPVTAFSGT